MESPISVQSKSLLCRWEKIIWSSIFYNKVTQAIMQNKRSCNIKLISMKSKTKMIEENGIPPCRNGPLVRVHMENFNLN